MNEGKHPILPTWPSEASRPHGDWRKPGSDEARRRAPPQTLDARAARLFNSLPAAYRLEVTRDTYPHVANRLAADWDVPRRMVATFAELLIDARGNRRGFAFEAALELMQLRDYYFGTLHPELNAEPNARDPAVWRQADRGWR